MGTNISANLFASAPAVAANGVNSVKAVSWVLWQTRTLDTVICYSHKTNYLMRTTICYPAICFPKHFFFIKKNIIFEKLVKIFVSARKNATLKLNFTCVTHECTFVLKYKLIHNLPYKMFVSLLDASQFHFSLLWQAWYWTLRVLVSLVDKVNSRLTCQYWYFSNCYCHNLYVVLWFRCKYTDILQYRRCISVVFWVCNL